MRDPIHDYRPAPRPSAPSSSECPVFQNILEVRKRFLNVPGQLSSVGSSFTIADQNILVKTLPEEDYIVSKLS